MRALALSAYRYVWVCGLAASGKTTLLRELRTALAQSNVEFLSDSEEIVNFVSGDTSKAHHRSLGDTGFIVTDSEPFYYAVNSLLTKAATKSTAIIELSRGLDQMGVVDLSYRQFFEAMPPEIRDTSLIVYLLADRDTRFTRNSQRPLLCEEGASLPSFRCPEEPLQQFFSEDDFFSAVPGAGVDFVVVNNNGSPKSMIQKVVELILS